MYCSRLFSGFFFQCVLGLNLDVWDWKNKNWAMGVLQKSISVKIGFLRIPGFIFSDFGWPWEQFFMTFVAEETGLEFNEVSA